MYLVSGNELERFATAIFKAAGAPSREAQIVGHHLADANLAGHDSHGVLRIPQYFRDIQAGKIKPDARPAVVQDWDTGCVVEGRHAFGQVACGEAMEHAIAKARQHSVGIVALRRANHTGRLGAYVETAARAGMIGMVTCNAGGGGQHVAPFGGRQARLGTNPLALGAPSGQDFPIVLDMGTSIVPEGKVRHYLQRDGRVPDGWLIDTEGRPVNDPQLLYRNHAAAILPLGGQAGHKGFGLAFLVDILAGALSGSGCCRPGMDDAGPGQGLLLLAIDVQRFGPMPDFLRHVTTLTEHVQGCPPIPSVERVMVPGEFEHRQRQRRGREGIPIPQAAWSELQAVAATLHCSLPATLDRIAEEVAE
jgi:uncharacterized oxidoreductase